MDCLAVGPWEALCAEPPGGCRVAVENDPLAVVAGFDQLAAFGLWRGLVARIGGTADE